MTPSSGEGGQVRGAAVALLQAWVLGVDGRDKRVMTASSSDEESDELIMGVIVRYHNLIS